MLLVYGQQDPVKVDIQVALSEIHLDQLFAGNELMDETAGVLGGHAKLSSYGRSVADILGGANGSLYLVMAGGQVSQLLVELAGLDVAEALGVVITGDEPTAVRCAVADFQADDGHFQAQSFVFDTNDTIIVGSGSINMALETMDLTLIPYAKDFSPLTLRSPISIGGTFTSLDAFPDPLRTGNDTLAEKVVSAILTPLLGLAPPFDTELGKNANCDSLIARARSVE
ncbi:MAG: AsmA family protein [Rhodospirillales bacterium]|nr:AsmA family protein [Rhodospirillales bacterium]